MKWQRAPRRRRVIGRPARTLAALAVLTAFASCREQGPSEPDSENPPDFRKAPPSLTVSDPTGGVGSSGALSASVQTLTYVSASPGTFPGAVSVTITNLADGGSATGLIQDDGFDPVALAAQPGDELEIVVGFADGTAATYRVKVPVRRPPRVVRTRPPKGDTDVTLNATVSVVFSEPVDSSTVTQETVQLRLDGDRVEGIVTLSEDRLRAEFVPAEPLQPETIYRLVITTGVLDLDGDPLEEEVHATFTTVSPPPSNPPQIAFTSWRDDNGEIYVMNPDGTGVVNLTNSPDDDYDPVWSPDGSKIAFHTRRDGDREIYVMNADGSGQVNLTNSPGTDRNPAWSPDGSKIAFDSDRDGDGEIYVMNADGTGLVNLTNHGNNDWDPAWSPNGSKIAFGTWRDGNPEIYVMNADGGDPVNLSKWPGLDGNPVWSPNGRKIAFVAERPSYGNQEIYVMNANGTGHEKLTNSPGSEFDPAWSPDGSRIAFRYVRDDDVEIYVMSADGTGRVNLTNSAGYEYYPVWSPDGSKIAYEFWSGSSFEEIYVMNANGSRQVNLTRSPRSDLDPAWRPR